MADADALDAHARARDERRRLAREVERVALPARLQEVEVAAATDGSKTVCAPREDQILRTERS